VVSNIERLDIGPARLLIEWADGRVSDHPWIWVRDHSHDPATIHPHTFQRELFTASVDPALHGVAAELSDDAVVVSWSDPGVPPSVLPIAFLAEHIPGEAVDPQPERVLWDGDSIVEQWPTAAYGAVIDDDRALAGALAHIARFGFCVITGTPTSVEATERLARRVGYVRETIFGGMWDFQADLSKADTAYTDGELRPHTDGTYSLDAPGLQLLHCLAFDGTGGESTMVDGFRVAAQLRVAEPELYEVLSSVAVPGQYLGDGVHLRAARPVFRHDADGLLEQVSFNNADRAPFSLPADEMERFYDALRAFERRVNDPRLQWRRVNPPGDAMLFDNWRVLHGRAGYTGHRHMCGCYVNREDYLSRRRMLASV
jgi:trimethyllysine dioxygenase